MDKITIDGRFLILIVVLIVSFFLFIVQTMNIWLENQNHRKARAWDNSKCRTSFIDFLAEKISSHQFFIRSLIIVSIPFVLLWLLVRYPHLFIRKAVNNFHKQINSALDYLRK